MRPSREKFNYQSSNTNGKTLSLNNIDRANISTLSDQELWDITIKGLNDTDNGNIDFDIEKIKLIEEELHKRTQKQMEQYGEIQNTIQIDHKKNMEKVEDLKHLLDDNYSSDSLEKLFNKDSGWNRETQKKIEWISKSVDTHIEQDKEKFLDNLYDFIVYNNDIKKLENNLQNIKWWIGSYEFNEKCSEIASKMFRKFENFVEKDNHKEQIKKMWLDNDINKLYTLLYYINYAYWSGQWAEKLQNIKTALWWILKYTTHGYSWYENSMVDNDYYRTFVWPHTPEEKII